MTAHHCLPCETAAIIVSPVLFVLLAVLLAGAIYVRIVSELFSAEKTND